MDSVIAQSKFIVQLLSPMAEVLSVHSNTSFILYSILEVGDHIVGLRVNNSTFAINVHKHLKVCPLYLHSQLQNTAVLDRIARQATIVIYFLSVEVQILEVAGDAKELLDLLLDVADSLLISQNQRQIRSIRFFDYNLYLAWFGSCFLFYQRTSLQNRYSIRFESRRSLRR